MQAKNTQQADIIIVGAGMSGCLLALAIIKQSPALNVILIDNNNKKIDKGLHPGFDGRSIALSIGSCDLLAQLALWHSLVENGQPIKNIHISDRGHLGIVELENAPKNQPYGYVVELQEIGQSLQRQLALTPQIKRIYNSAVIDIKKQPDFIVCELQDKQLIQAKLCVAADGASSKTAALLSIKTDNSDYGCSAIIANVGCDKPHQNRAFERFTEAGPLALLPLSDNRYSLVWSVKNSELASILALNEQMFLAKLQSAFGYRAGIFNKAGKRASYPLKLIKTEKPITHRGLAIGNAAHCLHPVMGQGFNLGMRDLSVLASVIASSDDIGGFSMLNKYWSARKSDHNATIKLTDAIVHTFSNNILPFVIGRNIALQAISCIPSLGAPIVKQAKGQFELLKKEEKS